MRKMALVLFLLAVFSLKTSAQGICCQNLSADELMTEVVAKAKENDELKQKHLAFEETYLMEEFNFAGQKRSGEHSNKSITGERKQFAQFKMGIGDLLQILVARHQFSFADPEQVILNGRVCTVVEFRPKEGLTDITNEDRFINRLRGKLWIDAQNHALWLVEANIPEEDEFNFKVWRLFFFATINVKNFELEFQQTEYMGIMVENQIRVRAKFIVLSATRTRKYDYQYKNYRYR